MKRGPYRKKKLVDKPLVRPLFVQVDKGLITEMSKFVNRPNGLTWKFYVETWIRQFLKNAA